MTWNRVVIPFFFLLSLFSRAQDLNYVSFNTHNGLPSSEVHDLYQDKHGYLWIATDRGLCRYNGREFKTYGTQDGIPNSVILRFFPQENGKLWCRTVNNRIFYVDTETTSIHPFKYNDSLTKYLFELPIEHMVELNDGAIRFSPYTSFGSLTIGANGEIDSDLCTLELDSLRMIVENIGNNDFFSYRQDKNVPFENKDAIDVTDDCLSFPIHGAQRNKDVRVLFYANNLVFYKGQKEIKRHQVTSKLIRIGKSKNLIWVSVRNRGITFYDMEGNEIESFMNEATITGFVEDHEGGMWFSTLTQGVRYAKNLNVRHTKLHKGEAIENLVQCPGGLRINHYNSDSYLLKTGSHQMGTEETSFFHTITEVVEGQLFNHELREERYVFEVTSKEGDKQILNDRVFFRNISDDGTYPLLICGNNVIGIYDDKKFTHVKIDYKVRWTIIDIASVSKKVFWLARGKGLFQYNIETNESKKHPSKELDIRISEIDHIRDDEFCVGTKGNGVCIINGFNLVKHFGVEDGLKSNIITEVYVENANTYWVCTHAGLNRIRKEGNNYFIDSFTTNDGLLNNDVTDIVVKNDTAWVATKSGLDYFPTNQMTSVRPKTKVFLELLSTQINGRKKNDLLHLSSEENKVEFNFKAISFRYKDRLRFRYKMKGLETGWNYTNEQRVSYKSLPPGSYELVIQAGVGDNWYDEEIHKKLYIATPFYAAWWFITGVVLVVLVIFYLFFRFRILSYNRFIIQEILRQILRILRLKDNSFVIRVDGADVKIDSNHVHYARALGNYVEISTLNSNYVVREKISEFIDLVPDSKEYIQINRSVVIRKDKVTKKSRKMVTINGQELKIGSTYKDVYDQLYL